MKIEKKILEIEKEYSLYSFKVEGVFIWKLIRTKLVDEIAFKKDIYTQAHSTIKKNYFIFFKNLLSNTLTITKKSQNLFFLSNRMQEIEGKYVEIYSYKLIEKYKTDSEIVYFPLIEKSLKDKTLRKTSIENLDYIIFEIIKYFKKLKINNESLEKINLVKNKLEKDLNISDIEILSRKKIEEILIKFKVDYQFYKRFLKKRCPQRIFIVCSYGKEALISAAQDLGIEVVEIQHGSMNQYHLGYHFPDNKTIQYFPNRILVFGKYWAEKTAIPLSRDKIEIIGYPYMKLQIDKYSKNIKERENQILFISQGTIGKNLTEKAVEFAKENPNLNVIIRLHPGEFNRWKTEYKILFENKSLKNLIISDNNNKNLYEYMCESKYLIGVYSTAIYEGLYLEKKIGVLNLPGIEHIEDLIRNSCVQVYNLTEKIDIRKLENLKRFEGNYYFDNREV